MDLANCERIVMTAISLELCPAWFFYFMKQFSHRAYLLHYLIGLVLGMVLIFLRMLFINVHLIKLRHRILLYRPNYLAGYMTCQTLEGKAKICISWLGEPICFKLEIKLSFYIP